MKLGIPVAALLVGIALGWFAGSAIWKQRLRAVMTSGPYSDHYGPARQEIAKAIEKLREGNANVEQHLIDADEHIKLSQQWTEQFIRVEDKP